MYLKLWATALFIFVSFQTLGRGPKGWFYNDVFKLECRFTAHLETTYFPQFDCSGNLTKGLSSICKGSIECKNHEDIRTQFPVVICKHEDKSCSSITPIQCLVGSASVYRNQELQNILPEHLMPPKEEIIHVIEEI